MRTDIPHLRSRVCWLVLGLSLLTACAGATSHDEPEQAQAQALTLRPGDKVPLGDQGALRYVRTVNDSRCPVDVQCVWAGDAEVLFEFTVERKTPQPLTLTFTQPTMPLGARWIHLIALERGAAPAATIRIDDAPAAPGR
ncbi:hypothetical protein J2X06_003573 [Lysobacter niastensis]|uniref:Lipoprotein n=1 Tax=Lysobacter niastensis TaxID=380629 RepID=A0ABU1WFI2_9GAMM|nr:hypothetical protein [Lysobacter niastensis]MDR7136347.1 hypothetical protein [Lysobacter niastensis]